MKHARSPELANCKPALERKSRSKRPRTTASPLKPLHRPDLVQEVMERLREQIIAGAFDSDGSLPPEGQLGETLGVSRTVIREAMRILAAQGLVDVSQGRQTRVRPADPQTIVDTFSTYLQREDHSLLDLIEVRRPLEAAIAALAAERATPDQVQDMEESLNQLASARSASRRVEADLRFHELLAGATGNPIFQLLLTTLAGLMRRSRETTLARTGVEPSLLGHGAVLAAVKLHDPDAARQAMLNHLTEAEQGLRERNR